MLAALHLVNFSIDATVYLHQYVTHIFDAINFQKLVEEILTNGPDWTSKNSHVCNFTTMSNLSPASAKFMTALSNLAMHHNCLASQHFRIIYHSLRLFIIQDTGEGWTHQKNTHYWSNFASWLLLMKMIYNWIKRLLTVGDQVHFLKFVQSSLQFPDCPYVNP